MPDRSSIARLVKPDPANLPHPGLYRATIFETPESEGRVLVTVDNFSADHPFEAEWTPRPDQDLPDVGDVGVLVIVENQATLLSWWPYG